MGATGTAGDICWVSRVAGSINRWESVVGVGGNWWVGR